MDLTSLITLGKFSSACANFLQRDGTKSLLKSIKNELEQQKYAKLKKALSIMDDAQKSTNSSNIEYYTRAAYENFVEAISLYSPETDRSLFFKAFSSIKNIIRTEDQILANAEPYCTNLCCFMVACLGAGICSFYLGEYTIAVKYFDKALEGAVCIEMAKVLPSELSVYFITPIEKDILDVFITLEDEGRINNLNATNLKKIEPLFESYKKRKGEMFI